MTTHHHGDDHAPYYRIHKDATGETVAAPDHRDHPATGRDHTSATTDDHDQDDATSDQEETMATTRTKPATKKPTGRTARHGAEISIGLTLLTIGLGVGVYHLIASLLGWPRDVALVAAGLASGLLASAVLSPLWRHLRAIVGGWIHPGKASR